MDPAVVHMGGRLDTPAPTLPDLAVPSPVLVSLRLFLVAKRRIPSPLLSARDTVITVPDVPGPARLQNGIPVQSVSRAIVLWLIRTLIVGVGTQLSEAGAEHIIRAITA